jgi:hypothetical protein
MTTYDQGLAVVTACALAACQPTADANAEPPRPATAPANPGRSTDRELPPSQRFERDMMLRFHMLSSFDAARTIERLLLRGNLDDARYFARALATEPDVPGLGPWAKQVGLVRDRAAAVATAPAIEEACRRTAGLVEACAGCHAEAGAQEDFRPPHETPPDLPTVAARMARHRWATDRIREGMIGDADDAWRAGFEVLAAAPMSWPQPGAEQGELARRLQQLASQALHSGRGDRAARARLYGETLIVCAACHAQPTR